MSAYTLKRIPTGGAALILFFVSGLVTRSHGQTRKKRTHLRHKRAVQLQIKLVLLLRNTFCLISTFRVEADPLFFDLQLRGTLDVRGLDGEVDNVL